MAFTWAVLCPAARCSLSLRSARRSAKPGLLGVGLPGPRGEIADKGGGGRGEFAEDPRRARIHAGPLEEQLLGGVARRMRTPDCFQNSAACPVASTRTLNSSPPAPRSYTTHPSQAGQRRAQIRLICRAATWRPR